MTITKHKDVKGNQFYTAQDGIFIALANSEHCAEKKVIWMQRRRSEKRLKNIK